jgi:alkaline phosphatase D
LPKTNNQQMKSNFRILLVLFSFFLQNAYAQIKSGPMLGYSDMKEVLLWVQTEKAAKVKFCYWDKEAPAIKYFTDEASTSKNTAFVTKQIADQVQPGKKYGYEVYVNNKKVVRNYPMEFQTQTLWQFRTDPPAFKFAVGSCTYTNETEVDRPGTPYGKDIRIFEKIYDQKPNFMVWGGDNIYLREVDWFTKTGINHRYTHFKSQKELQPLWANVHHYAIWDDHDFGPNDSDRTFWGKNMTLESFKNFWGNQNYIFENEGVTGSFMWEDVQFFLTDNRYFRASNNLLDENKDFFGEKQLKWLIEALATSTAPFKFVIVGGQVVNPAPVFENMATFPGERQRLLAEIEKNKISGVIFITGDRHHTNLQKLERGSNYPLYDLTVSPLTSSAGSPIKEEYEAKTIVEGTEVNNSQTFGILEVSGKRTDRVLKINIMDAQGNKKWDYEIKARDLRAK